MASILEVIEGISQAIHAKQEGGTKFGLRRESQDLLQGVSIYDPRVIDGFGVQFQGDMLLLKYHSEVPLTEVHDKNFETDTKRVIKDITTHIKSEYKRINKKNLELTENGDIKVMVQSANRKTCYVNAVQSYKIGGVEIDKGSSAKEKKVYDSEQDNYTNIAKRWLMNIRNK